MIKVEHLTKYYGDVCAVDDLSFEIGTGRVYGFLGPNGAGKSTTMNIMTGCLSASAGSVTIGGYDIFDNPSRAKKLIGYLPEQPPLYLGETPAEYLEFVRRAKGVKKAEAARQIRRVMEQTGITAVAGKRIADLSKGYRQRVGIAQALLGNPRVIILDEPTVGLDPIQIIEIRRLIKKLGEQHTVILSSHILSEVQAICDRVLIISHGRLLAFDRPDNLEKSLGAGRISLTAEASESRIKKVTDSVKSVYGLKITRRENGTVDFMLKTDSKDIYRPVKELFFAFADRKIPLLTISPRSASLEDIFLELTDGAGDTQPKDAADEAAKTAGGENTPLADGSGEETSGAVAEIDGKGISDRPKKEDEE